MGYKQVWHKDNERLLHDILCFANTVHDRDCYIMVGISDDGKVIGLNGSSGTGETHAGVYDEEAHRPPR
ncbi:ATP-binding protein [Metabacillus sediminilitoris]|uniref:ATP-binding protein n=1 Tax=Metabacillus sediminilitoris TaxID=2567941 RepID=UPI001D0D9CF1|nr:ATP-binding protein [Metabacillus sediminilitoris]